MFYKKRKKSRKPGFIKAHLRDHSRHQLELNCEVAAGDGIKAPLLCHTVMLLPQQFGVDLNDRSRIYDAMVSMIRFREPKSSGKRLIRDREFGIQSLASLLDEISQSATATRQQRFEAIRRIRTYGAIFYDFVGRKRHKITAMMAHRDDYSAPESGLVPWQIELKKVIKRCRISIDQLANLVDEMEIQDPPSKVDKELRNVLEFCNYAYADFLQEILGQGAKLKIPWNGLKVELGIDREIANFRTTFAARNFCWVNATSSDLEKEQAINRRRYLKRQIMSELYLKTKNIKRIWLEENFGAMLAASMAAAWATAIHIALLVSGNSLDFAEIGASSATIFVTVIVAYVMKDRIKDIGKSQFRRTFSKFLSDHVWLVFGSSRADGKQEKVLKIFEKVEFSQPKKTLGEYGIKMPDTMDSKALSSKAIILKQAFSFAPAMAKQPFKSLRQILRLDVYKYLGRLDDSSVELFELDESGDVRTLSLPKLYYGYCIINSRPMTETSWQTLTYKITFSKKGIERIENVDLSA